MINQEKVNEIMLGAKPGTIRIIEFNSEIPFENPIVLPFPKIDGARMILCGNNMGNDSTLGFTVARGGPGKNSNDRTARWRNRHGGAFSSPLNKKFKIKT